LNNAAGYAVLKGGRFVALGSVIIQVAKHNKFSSAPLMQISDALEHSA